MTGKMHNCIHRSWIFFVSTIFFIILTAQLTLAQENPGECLSEDEASLGQLINDYRQSLGLLPIPVTVSLTTVAQWHAWDLDTNTPYGGECNLHSWSDGALWTPVCYTSDHANASGMWDKPREITSNTYTGNGFEIAYWTSGTASPESALVGWQGSPGHNEVMINAGIWQSYNPWPAMGVGMRAGYAVVWFGPSVDSQGTMPECGEIPSGLVTWGAIKAFYRSANSK